MALDRGDTLLQAVGTELQVVVLRRREAAFGARFLGTVDRTVCALRAVRWSLFMDFLVGIPLSLTLSYTLTMKGSIMGRRFVLS